MLMQPNYRDKPLGVALSYAALPACAAGCYLWEKRQLWKVGKHGTNYISLAELLWPVLTSFLLLELSALAQVKGQQKVLGSRKKGILKSLPNVCIYLF